VLLLALAPAARAQEPGRPPDILIVMADDLSVPDLADAPTPSIDALAAAGVTLTQFVGMPICSPARHALLHGRWPRRSGLGGNVNSYQPPSETNVTPSPELLSLPKVLAQRGYHTALVGKWHLGQAAAGPGADPTLTAPQAHGFEHWLAGAPANLRSDGGTGYKKWVRVDDGARRMETEYATQAMRDAALDWWQKTPSPKFLLVSLSAPHQPLSAPPAEMLPPGFDASSGADRRFLGMVASIDHVVGKLRAASDPEHTLFLFLADNGTAPLVHGVKRDEAKGTTRERGIRVPFVAAGPGVARGQVSQAQVSIVDLLATLAEVAGARVPVAGQAGGEDSRSFLGALREPATWQPERAWVLAERYDGEGDDLALRTPRWKLRRDEGVETLVDLVHDPDEEHPLAADGELDLEQRAALDNLRAILAHDVPPRN